MSSQDDMATTNGVSGLPPPGKVSGVCVCVRVCVCGCLWVGGCGCVVLNLVCLCVCMCVFCGGVCMYVNILWMFVCKHVQYIFVCVYCICVHACVHFDLSLYDESTSRLGCWTFLGGHSSLSQVLLEPCWNYTDHLATYLWVWVEGEQWQTFSKNGHWNLPFLICLMKDNMDSPDKSMGQSECWLLVAEATSQFTTP